MSKTLILTVMFMAVVSCTLRADLPPEQWLKMRQSGFSSRALTEYMKMKGTNGGSFFPMPGKKPAYNESDIEALQKSPLVSATHIIGNGKWFHVDYPLDATAPPHVVVLGPDRLIIAEAILKSQRRLKLAIRAKYRIPDAFTNLKRFVPAFAVAIERLPEVVYHETFSGYKANDDLMAKLKIDPRVGRVEALGEKISCRWERDAFAPKEFSSVALFDERLNFSWACFRGKGSGKGRFTLIPSFGSILKPMPGDFVIPFDLVANFAPFRGQVVFNRVKKPLVICNLFGKGKFTKAFPKWLFPGLYRFGVTVQGQAKNAAPLCFVIVRNGVATGVDFQELGLKVVRGGNRQIHLKQLFYHHYRPK